MENALLSLSFLSTQGLAEKHAEQQVAIIRYKSPHVMDRFHAMATKPADSGPNASCALSAPRHASIADIDVVVNAVENQRLITEVERMHDIVGDGELDALASEIDGLRAELLSQADRAAHSAGNPKVGTM